MSDKYKNLTGTLSKNIATFRKAMPDVASGFDGLMKGATKTNALDEKTKELISLGIAVAGRCQGCIGFHTMKAIKLGVTREEFMEVLGTAVYMGGGPSLMYAGEAVEAFEEFSS